jgi:hypothetical protein
VISAKPQVAVVRSAAPALVSTTSPPVATTTTSNGAFPYAAETMATNPSSMIPAPPSYASSSSSYQHPNAVSSSAYQSRHMGMTPDEARLMESQQRGYDYDKQQRMAATNASSSSSGGGGQKEKHVRTNANGQTWEDPTLQDWPENDHRLFVGDLGNNPHF